MRNEIFEKLLEWQKEYGFYKDEARIFYGIKPNNVELEDWDYIVFGSLNWKKSGTNKLDLNRYYFVNIICENFIDDDLILSLIKKMLEIKGLSLDDDSFQVEYLIKGNTDITCEAMSIAFTKPLKGILCQE